MNVRRNRFRRIGKMRFRGVIPALLVLALLFSLGSCGRSPAPAEVFTAFFGSYRLPPGQSFDSTLRPDEEGALTRELFSELFARADGGDDYEDFSECVIWLGTSPSSVAELGIFLCPDRGRAEHIALTCRQRIALLRSLSASTDVRAANNAQIVLYGRTCVYMCLPDTAAARRVMDRIF